MRSLAGDVLSADVESRSTIHSVLRWAFVGCTNVLSLVASIVLKATSNSRYSTFASGKPELPGPHGVDDGRYDYGLSQPSHQVTFEGKVRIPMRDGTKLIGDVFRPASPGRFPVIMGEAPYPRYQRNNPGVDDVGGAPRRYHQFEQANPDYWVPRGYVYVSFNARGFQGSEGKASIWDLQEAQDYYDAIEWAAAQPWSSGAVGLFGISYYAFSQYWVASLQPPHLKAIVPWEGLADCYRDIAYRGGIPCWFTVTFATMARSQANDLLTPPSYLKDSLRHPLYDEYWLRITNPAPEKIEVPMLSVGALGDPDLHLRGNVNSFVDARSPHKQLLLYSGTHWGSAFQPWANRTVLRFFDHWLKGVDTGLVSEPAIDVQVRTGPDTFTHVYGERWPLEQTEWTKYYLDAAAKALSEKDAPKESTATAQPRSGESGSSEQVAFVTAPLQRDVAIAGPIVAHLWVSSSTRDVDLTLELHDFDENGKETMFAYAFAGRRDEPVTRGWLRASHRALDPKRSRPHQPYHLHTHNDWLTPGVPVAVDVEVWPTAMVFKTGHRIGLTVHCGPYSRTGMAVMSERARVPMFGSFSPRSGTTNIHTGGEHCSWLELPVIPADPAPCHALVVDDERFSPARVTGQMGDRFAWTNSGQDYHSVTERSGLRLWDSQLIRGLRSHNPETWSTKIPWAGTFAYRDEVSGFEGMIAIPVRAPQTSGAGQPVEIELGLAPPPDGAGFDLELSADGGEWSRIHEGIRAVRIATPRLAAGRYSVRCRLRSLDATREAGAETDWSPLSTIEVG